MKFRLASTIAILTLGLAGTAVADTYLGLGIGTEAPITGSLGDAFSTDDATHGRLVLGKRFGKLAIEGSIFGTEMFNGGQEAAIAALGVDLKYHLPLASNFEAYVKGGLHKAYVQSDTDGRLDEFEGQGHQYGAGLQYRFNMAVSSAALWLDYSRTQFDVADEGAELGGTAKMLQIGVSIGF